MFSKTNTTSNSRLPRVSMIVACLALFVVVGGSAYAAKKNSIGTKQLKTAAVKERTIAPNAVSTTKIKDNAIDGAKVNEATLGKVPTAAKADTATNATNATNAASADDAGLLGGLTVEQVRSNSAGLNDLTSQGLDDNSYETVMQTTLVVPAGGGDVSMNASVELVNNAAGQHGAQCRLRSEGTVTGPTYTTTITTNGISQVIPLTAFINNAPGTPVGNPLNIDVQCTGSLGVDDIFFTEGSLVANVSPVG